MQKNTENDKGRLSQFDYGIDNVQCQCYTSNQINTLLATFMLNFKSEPLFIAENLLEPENLIINVDRLTNRQTNIPSI